MRRVEEQKNNSNILIHLSKKQKVNHEKSSQKNIEIESSGINCSQIIPQASELGRTALRINIYVKTIIWNGQPSKHLIRKRQFSHNSIGEESACKAEDPSLIPGLGRPLGEGNENPLKHSCLQNPMGRGAWQATVLGVARVRPNLVTQPTNQN